MTLPLLDAPSSRDRTLHASGTSDVFTAPLSGRGFEDGGALVVVKRSKITCARDIERFEREASLLASLAHDCVVRPLGLIRSPPTYALVLPLHARGSLFRALHNSGAGLSLRSRASLVADACAAVAHLHERGVVHRDVKPDNYLLREDGAAVLTDFNAAERSDAVSGAITLHARPTGGFFKQYVVGTLPYMAPELITRGGASGAALDFEACDMYSLGITANEVLARAVPYSDALTETAQLHTILEARYNHDALVVAITSQQLRPALPPLEPSPGAPPPQLVALVQKLWAQAA